MLKSSNTSTFPKHFLENLYGRRSRLHVNVRKLVVAVRSGRSLGGDAWGDAECRRSEQKKCRPHYQRRSWASRAQEVHRKLQQDWGVFSFRNTPPHTHIGRHANESVLTISSQAEVKSESIRVLMHIVLPTFSGKTQVRRGKSEEVSSRCLPPQGATA